MSTAPKVIVFGIMIWYPLAGVRYQFLHYLTGLRKLGFDVYYIEDSQYSVYDAALNDYTYDATNNIRDLAPFMQQYGFEDKWAFRGYDEQIHGMSREALYDLFKTADACLNVTGGQDLKDEHMTIPRRVYVESDPFAQQVRIAQGDPRTLRFLDAHTHFFSFGENFGSPDCTVPLGRYQWQPTRQPVDMDLWRGPDTGGSVYNTITTWQNKTEGILWNGERYHWTKDIEFRKYLDLPAKRPGCKFELAAGTTPEIKSLLTSHGWANIDSLPLSLDHALYNQYIQRSRGEFTVARDQYARPRTGWFSDRSVCYLAAGRPVITQETGFSNHIKSSRGLFGYNNMDDILAAVDSIESDYPGQCRAARDVAHAYFSTDVVLGSLMKRIGL